MEGTGMKAWLWLAAFAVALVPLASAETTEEHERDPDDHGRPNERKGTSNASLLASERNDRHEDERKPDKEPRDDRTSERDNGASKKTLAGETERRKEAGSDEPAGKDPEESLPGTGNPAAPPDLPAAPKVQGPPQGPATPEFEEPTQAPPVAQEESKSVSAPPVDASDRASSTEPAVAGLAAPAPGLVGVGSAPGPLAEILQNVAAPNGSRAAPTQLAPLPDPVPGNPQVAGGPEPPAQGSRAAMPGGVAWSSFAAGALTVGALTAGALGGYTVRLPKRQAALPPKASKASSLADLIRRIREMPLDAEAHFQLAVELLRQEEPQRAANHLERSIRLRPDLVMRLLEDPVYEPILQRDDVRRVLRRFHREQQQRLWAGYS